MGKTIARLGTALALVFIGVIVLRGVSELPPLNLLSGHFWTGLIGGLFLYLLAQIIGAFAWNAVLRIYDVALPFGRAESQLLLSQIGKYIPGNVAHLFGRLALARADGIAGTVAGAAMLLEVAALLTTGVGLVGLIFWISPDLIGDLTAGLSDTGTAAIIAGVVVLIFVGLIVGQVVIWRRAGRPRPTLFQFLVPIVLHAANFGVLGLSLWWIVGAVVPDPVPILHCIAIFTVAWMLGFLMPGAPGGVGVRDGIIALGLELFIGQGAGLGVAVVHRLMSVLGDVVTFGLGWVLRKRTA